VHAFNPWPGSHTSFNWHDRKLLLKVHKAKALQETERAATDAKPGQVLDQGPGRLIVAAGDGSQLELLEIQPEGKRAMTAQEFCRGYPLPPGEQLG
jgi:methionyl-tRNA formyltransferase